MYLHNLTNACKSDFAIVMVTVLNSEQTATEATIMF